MGHTLLLAAELWLEPVLLWWTHWEPCKCMLSREACTVEGSVTDPQSDSLGVSAAMDWLLLC